MFGNNMIHLQAACPAQPETKGDNMTEIHTTSVDGN